MKRPAPRESQIALAIADYLGYRGWRVHRLGASRYQASCPHCSGPVTAGKLAGRAEQIGLDPGTPDYIAVHPSGRVLYIEVKAARGKLSPVQRAMHAALRCDGFEVLTPRSVADVMEYLEVE